MQKAQRVMIVAQPQCEPLTWARVIIFKEGLYGMGAGHVDSVVGR